MRFMLGGDLLLLRFVVRKIRLKIRFVETIQYLFENSTDIYSLYLNFRFLFFVIITEFVEFYVGTHRRASLQKPNFLKACLQK
jgi:hypothetical protein